MRSAARRVGPAPPTNEAELLSRAHALSGLTLGELAKRLERPLPPEPKRAKGFGGELIERALGASAKNAPEPDFPELGVELKTIPVDASGKPRESTFVCSIHFAKIAEQEWERSRVYRKLARVLWVPIETASGLAFARRRIGRARLWSPSAEELALLRADWEDLAALLCRGEYDRLSAHLGRYLQVRPKAAHGGMRTRGADEEGAPVRAAPRGFYLRARFTRSLFSTPELERSLRR